MSAKSHLNNDNSLQDSDLVVKSLLVQHRHPEPLTPCANTLEMPDAQHLCKSEYLMMTSKCRTANGHIHGSFMALSGTDETEGDALCETTAKRKVLKIVRRWLQN